MKTNNLLKLIAASTIVFLTGCASNLPMQSSLNDFVMMNTEMNSEDTISFTYTSNVTDGLTKPLVENGVDEASGHMGYNHTESATLERMLNEYVSNKYMHRSDQADNQISVELMDFWLEEFSVDSTGTKVLVALAGGELNYLCRAKVKVRVQTIVDGEMKTQVFTATAEDTYVSGTGTGTMSSATYKGQNSLTNTHARNINDANNKVVMMLNAFVEDSGL